MTLFLDPISNPPVKVLGLGVFDGLHLGHKQLFSKCTHLMTFSPHPDLVLNKRTSLKTITTLEEMRVIYPNIIALNFTKEIAALTPQAFCDNILLAQLNPKKIVVGYDYRFGHKRLGDVPFLSKWCEKNNIDFECIQPFSIDNVPVKSGVIRNALEQGEFNKAVALLGHAYIIKGDVIKGEGRGTSLGYPTANIAVSNNKLLPTPGVYTGRVLVEDTFYLCMIYIGSKPTFNGTQKGVEVYIHQFNQTIYNHNLTVFIEAYVRDELTFNDKEELMTQIKLDLTVLNTAKL